MASYLAITPERVVEAHNKAILMSADITGEFNHPSFGYSIGVAVCAVMHCSPRAKKHEQRCHYKDAKDAVWKYHRGIGRHVNVWQTSLDESHPYIETTSSLINGGGSWPEEIIYSDDDYIWPDDCIRKDPSSFISP